MQEEIYSVPQLSGNYIPETYFPLHKLPSAQGSPDLYLTNWNPEQLWKSFNHIHPQQVQNFYLKYQYRKACFFLISISAWS